MVFVKYTFFYKNKLYKNIETEISLAKPIYEAQDQDNHFKHIKGKNF